MSRNLDFMPQTNNIERALLAAAVVFAAVCGVAVAQDTVVTTPTGPAPGETLVDVNSWYAWLQPWLTMIASVVIPAVVAWVGTLFAKWFGVEHEAQLRESLQTALTNAAGLLIQALGPRASTMKGLTVGDKDVLDAVEYVKKAAPDPVAHWSLTGPQIAEKLEAKLGQMTPIGGTGPVPTQISGGLK